MAQSIDEILANENVTIDYICKLIGCNKLGKDEVMRNDKAKDKIYALLKNSDFSYSDIRNIVSTFGVKECIENLDIDKMMDSNNSYRYFVALNELDNKIILNTAAKNEKYYNHFMERADACFSILGNSNYDDVKAIVDKVNNSKEIPKHFNEFLSGISSNAMEQLVREDLRDDVLTSIVRNSSTEIKQQFISKNSKAVHLYKDLNVRQLVNEGIEFPTEILKQETFFEELKGKDFVEFRRNMNRLFSKNYSQELEKRIKDYQENIISEYDPETKMFKGYSKFDSREKLRKLDNSKSTYILDDSVKYDMYKYIDDKEKLKEVLQKATSDKLSAVIVDRLFSDTKNNVEININEMLRYNGKLSENERVLDDKKTAFYNNIKSIDALTSDEKLAIYNSVKDENMIGELYNDISALRNLSYKKISESLYKSKDNSEDLSFDETQRNDTTTYKLNGKPFNMLVRSLRGKYKEETNNKNSSYSLISSSNMKVFDEEGYIYGYDSISCDSIVNVYEGDSFSLNTEDKNVTDRPNRIMTPEEITDSDSGYSEINIKNKINEKYDGKSTKGKYKEMKPSYILALDKANPELVEESKRLNIPLVVVDRVKYKDRQVNYKYKEDEVKYDIDIN